MSSWLGGGGGGQKSPIILSKIRQSGGGGQKSSPILRRWVRLYFVERKIFNVGTANFDITKEFFQSVFYSFGSTINYYNVHLMQMT